MKMLEKPISLVTFDSSFEALIGPQMETKELKIE